MSSLLRLPRSRFADLLIAATAHADRLDLLRHANVTTAWRPTPTVTLT
jgi:hypothetical protein